MAETPNHGYNLPEEGKLNWYLDLNENFQDFEKDIELRADGPPEQEEHEPTSGAKYLDTAAGDVYLADGESWSLEFSFGGGGGGGIENLTGGDGIDPADIGDGDTLSLVWSDAANLGTSGQINDFSEANDLDADGNLTGGGGGGIGSLTGGEGIDPADIGDGDTLSAAWGDADDLSQTGAVSDFSAASDLDSAGAVADWSGAADLDASGSVTADLIGGLSGGAGIDPGSIGDGDELSVAWEDANDLDADGNVTSGGGGIENLTGGDGIDPADIGDGDTLSLVWSDAANLGTSGQINDFSEANDLDADGNLTGGGGGGIGSLTGGDGIDPADIGDGDTLSAAWGDASDLDTGGNIADFSGAMDLDASGSITADLIGGLSGGAGIDPSSIGDGDELSVAWEDANDLDADGNVTSGGGGIESLTGGDGIDPADIGDGDTLSLVWSDAANLGTSGQINDFSEANDLDADGNLTGGGGGGIGSLTGGNGIDPASIGDGDTLSTAWGDADDLSQTGAVSDFSAASDLDSAGAVADWSGAADLDASGSVTADLIGGLSGGAGIDPSSIGDGDELSVAWEDANDLDADGNVTSGGGGIGSLTGGDGIDPADIGDGDTLSAAWGDASDLDTGGNIADFSGATDLDASGALTKSVVEGLTGGDGINPSSIGDGDTLSVAPGDFAGTYLSTDGSSNLTVSAGSGLESNGSGSLQTALGSGLGFDGSNQVTLTDSSLTVAGNSVSLGGSTGIAHGDLSGITSNDHHTRPSAGNSLADNSNTFDVQESSINHNNLTNSGQSDAHHTRPSAGGGLTESSNTFAVDAGEYLTVSDFTDNKIAFDGDAEWNSGGATIAGGSTNTANSMWATVGGGSLNTASGQAATVPGGTRGAAEDKRSFVWNDRGLYHQLPEFDIQGLSSSKAVNGEPVTGSQTFSVSATGGVRFITGGNAVTYIEGGSTGWATTSTRSVKTNIDPVDPADALAGVESMEVATWEYTEEDDSGAGTTHIGPMAEDFHDAFDVGSSDEHINSINADGVALAAIQGLSAEVEETREELDEAHEELDEREERIADLEVESDQKDDRIESLEAENERLRERLAAVEEQLGLDSGASTQSHADD